MKDTIYYFLHDYLLYMIFFYFFVLFLVLSKKNSTTQNVETKRNYSDYFTRRKYSKPFTVDDKNNYSQKMKDSKIKGDNYEIYVSEYYKNLGYDVFLNGIEKGKKDKGIDLICENNDNLILVQCKNWEINSKYKINHEKLKSFIGSCAEHINEHKLFDKNVKFVYITSNDIIDKSGKWFLKESKTLEYMVLPYDEKIINI